jgi:hypothetical protein
MSLKKTLDELSAKQKEGRPKGLPPAKYYIQANYVGPETAFWGHTALIREDPELKNYVLAQFDDMSLRYKGIYMGYAWTAFPKHHWRTRDDGPAAGE